MTTTDSGTRNLRVPTQRAGDHPNRPPAASCPTHDRLARPLRRTDRPATAHLEA
jgi:hypothetical protein